MSSEKLRRPPRTLGLSLAIWASVMLFTILPLLQVSLILALQYRFGAVTLPPPNEGDSPIESITGGIARPDDADAVNATLAIQVVLGFAYLPLAVMAWVGRPPSIRYIMIGVVIVLMIATVGVGLISLSSPQTPQTGLDSGASLARTLLLGRTAASGLVALYVVWYMNRGPARAFYRGHYLPEPEQQS